MAIKHKLASLKSDGQDSSVVRPSNWNDEHDHVPFSLPISSAPVTWTNMPSAATEFTGNPRMKVDLTHAVDVRMMVCMQVAGVSGSTLKLQYSTDESAWNDLTSTVAIDSTGCKVTAWAAIAAGAKGDVFVRCLGAGGNGTIDPQFRNLCLQVR